MKTNEGLKVNVKPSLMKKFKGDVSLALYPDSSVSSVYVSVEMTAEDARALAAELLEVVELAEAEA